MLSQLLLDIVCVEGSVSESIVEDGMEMNHIE